MKTKFYKLRRNSAVSGVLAGLSDKFGLDVGLVRFLFVLFTISNLGLGIIIYIILSSVMPYKEDMEEESFDIKGVHFSYGDKFIKKFGYHRPSTQGGYIKKDGQYLKIGYISTEKGYVIVKIQERK